MLAGLLLFLVYLVALVIIGALLLWAVRYFLPELYPPARLVVGGVVIIILLLLLIALVQGRLPQLAP
jgi:hypothetical protein